MTRLTPTQQKKFVRVLHEYKYHDLHSGSKKGPIVQSKNQALAIAYSEANALKRKKGALRRTGGLR